jgi:hypothetical protein
MRGWRKKDLINNLIINKLERRINMCLIVKEGCKPEIARKDITCWKRVVTKLLYGNWMPVIFAGIYRTFPLNKVATALKDYKEPISHLEIEEAWDLKTIDYGFHAKTKFVNLNYNICVIPAGAEYCLGTDNEIVATQIIVFDTYANYIRYVLNKWIHSIF